MGDSHYHPGARINTEVGRARIAFYAIFLGHWWANQGGVLPDTHTGSSHPFSGEAASIPRQTEQSISLEWVTETLTADETQLSLPSRGSRSKLLELFLAKHQHPLVIVH